MHCMLKMCIAAKSPDQHQMTMLNDHPCQHWLAIGVNSNAEHQHRLSHAVYGDSDLQLSSLFNGWSCFTCCRLSVLLPVNTSFTVPNARCICPLANRRTAATAVGCVTPPEGISELPDEFCECSVVEMPSGTGSL